MECEAPPDNDWFSIDVTLTFVKRSDYKKVMSKPLLHFYWGGFLSIKHDIGYNLSTGELLAPSSRVKTFISMKRRSVMLQFVQWNVNFTFNSPLVRRGHLHEPGMHFSWLWWITKDPQKPHTQAWGENSNPAKKGTGLGLLNGNSSVETILGCKVSTVIFLCFLLFLIAAFILGLLACVHFQSIPYG